MAARRELLGGAGDELVDLVPVPHGWGLTCAMDRDSAPTGASLET